MNFDISWGQRLPCQNDRAIQNSDYNGEVFHTRSIGRCASKSKQNMAVGKIVLRQEKIRNLLIKDKLRGNLSYFPRLQTLYLL